MAFPTGWSGKHKITIDNTKVSGTSNFTDIPIQFTESNFLAAAFSNSQSREIETNYLSSDANLQGYWKLESDGTDSSGKSNTLTGTPPDYVAAMFSNGGDFELSDSEYLSIADASQTGLDITGDITISLWYKPESVGSTEKVLVSKWDYGDSNRSYSLNFNSSDQLIFKYSGDGTNTTVFTLAVTTINLTAGIWYHIGVTADVSAKTAIFSINGVVTTFSSPTSGTQTSIYNGTAPFAIGCQFNSSSANAFVDGVIDDVAIFDRLFTAEELVGIYTGGADLRFSSDDAGTTQLAHEVVLWDTENTKAEVYVKIPTLAYDTDTVIYVWYNNSSATPQARDLADYGSEACWSTYNGVWHFNNITDSTANEITMTNYTGATQQVDGLVAADSAFQFVDSENDRVTLTSGSLQRAGNQSIYLLVKPTGINGDGSDRLVWNTNGVNYNRYLQLDSSERFNVSGNDVVTTTNTTTISDNNWYLVGWLKDDTNNTVKVTVNDSVASNTDNNTYAYYNGAFQICGNGQMDVVIDEIRFTPNARTPDYMYTIYNNLNSPSTFSTASAVSSISKFIGVAQASIKEAIGVTNANIKKIAGVSNS